MPNWASAEAQFIPNFSLNTKFFFEHQTLKIIIGQSVFVYLTLSLSLYLCICLFVFVFYSLGCIRTWGQTEEPNTEPFAMDKEKFAIHFFLQFLMILNGFFWHGALGYISIFTVDAKKTHPFTFLYRLQLSSKANSLT